MAIEFSVVEIPSGPDNTEMAKICTALVENVGKALAVDSGPRDPNTLRKSIRAALKVRGHLKTNTFNTKIQGNILYGWLSPMEVTQIIVDDPQA